MKYEVKICLDEIDAAYDTIERKKLKPKQVATLEGWVRKQKLLLKELKYKGKLRRLLRNAKK